MATASIIERKSYGVFRDATEMPNLLEVQLESYREFLQPDTPPDKRKRQGLHQIFLDIFPITDIHENYSLEYVGYHLGPSRYTIDECRARNMTYAAPLRVTMRLISRQGEGEKKEVKDIIEQDVYLGELPLLTEWGTFIVNGAERVVVSQLHRSPGVFFDEDMHPNGKKLYSARIIPYRGSWVEFAMDINDVMYVYIDSRRKMPATTLLRAIGYSSDEEILNLFYKVSKVNLKGKSDEDLATYVLAETIVNTESGEVILEPGETLDEEMVEKIAAAGYKAARVVDKVTNKREAYVILNTLRKDPTKSREEALMRIYALVRPGEPPTLEMAESLLEKFFFNNKRYDLGEVGRYMINHRMQINIDLNRTTLDPQDFVAIVKYLVGLVNDEGYVDDIDHLGNRRARTV
ncbi:MAG TPA: DNA-directed RNA polymerase subunit beta, partial [candidate division Zixibacteria bacterium]|nr:DNA-directed RNA polymerase subunit beta [candidate division Zixibacteria bacterium]